MIPYRRMSVEIEYDIEMLLYRVTFIVPERTIVLPRRGGAWILKPGIENHDGVPNALDALYQRFCAEKEAYE